MAVTCETVWRQSSEYIDGTLDEGSRLALEQHIEVCRQCAAVTQGLRNIVVLYGDERMGDVPSGFTERLHRRIAETVPPTRRYFLGWAVALAASVLAVGGIELSRSFTPDGPYFRSRLARHVTKPIPPEMLVVISAKGKLFHLAACPFILNRETIRTLTAKDAISEGFSPCTRCLSEYL
jgi:anti-sigma factor RsiW